MSGMKAKTIKGILRKQTDAWLSSIEDVAVREAAAKNTIITGAYLIEIIDRMF